MHIGIDGNLLCGKKTGMGTVVYSILRYWKGDDRNKITVFVPEKLDESFFNILVHNRVNVKVYGYCNYFKWEQVILPRAVREERVDVLWCPYNTAPLNVSCPMVVTVHDMIFMSLSLKGVVSLYKKAGVIYRRIIVPRAIKNADKVITISQFAKKEICGYFPTAAKKIEVVYNSADINVKGLGIREEKNFFEDNNIQSPYILGFGSLESRKNSMGLIRAYCQLPEDIKEKYQLVLFGFRGYEDSEEYQYIKNNSLKNIIVLGYISDEKKTTLYRNSEMFVFPTYSEGFGIPVLEAYANKTPVITSNVTAVPEIAGDAAILINPADTEGLAEAIYTVISNKSIQDEMKNKGNTQLKKFDWEKSAKKLFVIIENTVK